MMTLGIDAGPSKSGWSLVDFSIPTAPVWMDGGIIEDMLALLDRMRAVESLGLVAVEQPRAVWKPEANVHAVATAFWAGDAHGVFRCSGYRVVALGVNEWRQAFIGHNRRGDDIDAKVKETVERLVRGFPKRSNVNMRDATGVACVAARDWRQAVRDAGFASRGVHDHPYREDCALCVQSRLDGIRRAGL